MAGYLIYSVNSSVFQQLTTSPTLEQCQILADSILEDLEDLLDEYDDEAAADPAKWPLKPIKLAKSIQSRLSSADWYADMSEGDSVIFYNMLSQLLSEAGESIGIQSKNENDGFLGWDTTNFAVTHGASMLAEPKFGNHGFRYTGKSRGDLDLIYTIYLPPQVQALLQEIELVRSHFETLPSHEDGERDQFFRGLLEPVRRIAAEGRVMWVQTDT